MEVTTQNTFEERMRRIEKMADVLGESLLVLKEMADTELKAKSSGESPVDNAPIVAEAKEEDRFLRGYEAICKYLKISETTLWRLKKAKKIPIIQRGKMVYCDKREIDKVYFRR